MLIAMRRIFSALKIAFILCFIFTEIGSNIHAFEHALTGDNDHCNICQTAAQVGASTIFAPPVILHVIKVEQLAYTVEAIAYFQNPLPVLGYRSQAPPFSA